MALNSPTLEETGENEGPNTLSTTSGEQTFALRFVSTFAKVFGVLGGIWLVLEIISYFIPEKPLSTYRIKGLFGLFSLGMIVGLIWELIVLHRAYARTLVNSDELRNRNSILQRKAIVSGNHEAENSLIDMLRSLCEKELGGGYYSWQASQQTIVVDGSVPIANGDRQTCRRRSDF
jgi:hypothetical protein